MSITRKGMINQWFYYKHEALSIRVKSISIIIKMEEQRGRYEARRKGALLTALIMRMKEMSEMTQISNLDNWHNGFEDHYGTPLVSLMGTILINDYIKV